VPQQEQVSTTDRDSTYATKGGPARLGYYNNYLVDNPSCVIVGVQATAARLSQESVAAREMIESFREREGRLPRTLTADTSYGNGELLHWLEQRGITPYIRVKENAQHHNDLYGIDKFTSMLSPSAISARREKA
jgi:Transposase DDE domain